MIQTRTGGQLPEGRKQSVAGHFNGVSGAWEDHYDGRSGDYRVHFFAQRQERVLAALGDPAGRRILDIGCASGDVTLALAAAGAVVVGVDLAARMVQRAEIRRRHAPAAAAGSMCHASFGVADAERLPFADASFDAAICLGAIEYVPDDARAVAELFRVIKPGGCLVATAPHRDAPALQAELALHVAAGWFKRRSAGVFHRSYSAARFESRLSGAGFSVRSRRFVSYLPYNIAMRLPRAPVVDRTLRRLFEDGPLERLGVTMVFRADRPGGRSAA